MRFFDSEKWIFPFFLYFALPGLFSVFSLSVSGLFPSDIMIFPDSVHPRGKASFRTQRSGERNLPTIIILKEELDSLLSLKFQLFDNSIYSRV